MIVVLAVIIIVLRREINDTQAQVSSLQSVASDARRTLNELLVKSGALEASIVQLDLPLLQNLQSVLPRLRDNVTAALHELETNALARTLASLQDGVADLRGNFSALDSSVLAGEPVVLRSAFGSLVATARETPLCEPSGAMFAEKSMCTRPMGTRPAVSGCRAGAAARPAWRSGTLLARAHARQPATKSRTSDAWRGEK